MSRPWERRWNIQPAPGNRWKGFHPSNSNGPAPRRRLRHLAPAYDEFATTQKRGGVTHQSAYRAKDDPNSLLVTHGFATTAEAEAFLRGAELRDAMQRAGVQGQPRIEIYQDTWPFRRARRPSITGTAAGLAGPAMRSRLSRPPVRI